MIHDCGQHPGLKGVAAFVIRIQLKVLLEQRYFRDTSDSNVKTDHPTEPVLLFRIFHQKLPSRFKQT